MSRMSAFALTQLRIRHLKLIESTDRKINPGPPAQRFMKPPLSRYVALAQRRTNDAYVASRAIIGKEFTT
jgi:hypothetical protein